jgi:hypothetical protein
MSQLKAILISLMTASALLFMAQPAMAANLDCSNITTPQMRIQCGACAAAGGTCPSAPDNTISDTITNVINILSVVAGVAAVIFIILAGLRYITSAGNTEAAKSAKNTILYVVIGLIIVALAQIIVHFVLKNVTNTSSKSGSATSSQSTGRTGGGAGERPN